jgi:putative hydrolase of the HAD superfamily
MHLPYTESMTNTNHRPPRTVFFDAGNTLLNVQPNVGGIYEEVSKRLGCPVPATEFEPQLAAVWKEHQKRQRETPDALITSETKEYEAWRRLAHGLHGRIDALTCDRDQWFEALHREFGRPERFRMFPEVRATLVELKERRIRVGLISNWDKRLEDILDGTGLSELLDLVVISSLVGYAKPHERIFEIALEKEGLTPNQAVHVGDTYRDDIEGAKGVGIRPVLIRRSDGMSVLTGSTPPNLDCEVVESLSELPGLLL